VRSDRDREESVGMGTGPRRLYEVQHSQMVEWVFWPRGGNYGRLSPVQRDAFRLHAPTDGSLSPVSGDEGWHGRVHGQEDICDIPLLSRGNMQSPGMDWEREEGTVPPSDRSCGGVSPTSYDVFEGGADWCDYEW